MWEDDPIQANDPEFWGGANELCLNDYRKAWVSEHHRIAAGSNVLAHV
jgi:hypothetical protein